MEMNPRGRTTGHLPTEVSRSGRVQREAAETVPRSLVFMTTARQMWVHNGAFQLKLGSFRVVSGLRGWLCVSGMFRGPAWAAPFP